MPEFNLDGKQHEFFIAGKQLTYEELIKDDLALQLIVTAAGTNVYYMSFVRDIKPIMESLRASDVQTRYVPYRALDGSILREIEHSTDFFYSASEIIPPLPGDRFPELRIVVLRKIEQNPIAYIKKKAKEDETWRVYTKIDLLPKIHQELDATHVIETPSTEVLNGNPGLCMIKFSARDMSQVDIAYHRVLSNLLMWSTDVNASLGCSVPVGEAETIVYDEIKQLFNLFPQFQMTSWSQAPGNSELYMLHACKTVIAPALYLKRRWVPQPIPEEEGDKKQKAV